MSRTSNVNYRISLHYILRAEHRKDFGIGRYFYILRNLLTETIVYYIMFDGEHNVLLLFQPKALFVLISIEHYQEQ